MQRRLELKKKMYELAVERKISLQDIDDLLTFVFQIMSLPLQEESDFKQYFDNQENKRDMTQAAYQKKKLKTQKYMANLHAKAVYGLDVDDMVKQRKKDETLIKENKTLLKEKDIVLKEKDIVLKEKEDKMRHLILKLYTEEKKSVESIAEFMDMAVEEIDLIIHNTTVKIKK